MLKVSTPDGELTRLVEASQRQEYFDKGWIIEDTSEIEMMLDEDGNTLWRYKEDTEWNTISGGSGGTDTYKVKVDGTDTAAYLEDKLVEGSNVTITKADKKLTINASGIELGETSATAYRGDRGKTAYDHSMLTDGTNPHATTFENIASKPTTIAGYGITDGITLTGTETLSNKTLASPIITGNINTPSYTMYIRSSSGNTTFQTTGEAIVGQIGGGGISVGSYEKNSYAQFNGTTGAVQLKFANNATGKTATDGLNVGVLSDGTAEIRQMENLPLNIYTNNTLVATVSDTGVTSNLSGTWSTISDKRLKENITEITEPISKIESIAKCVKHYNFINQDKYAKGKRTGYIAQLLAENGLEGHVTQRTPNDEEEGILFGWTYKDEEYTEIVNEEEVKKIRRVFDTEGEMILGIENNFTPYLFPAFVALLERVKKLEEKLS